MSIEKITSKIIGDAQAEADALLERAQTERGALLAEAEAEARQILSKAEADGRSDKEKLLSRRKAVAGIDGRKIVLEEKQKLIASCFEQAVEKIVAMDADSYVDFLVRQLASTGERSGELILNPADAAAVGSRLTEAAAKAIPDGSFTLSAETRNIKGGFLLKNGSIYVNCAVEALVEESKEELAGEVAARLFE